MSRGYGKTQRTALDTLKANGMLDAISVAAKALGRDSITPSEASSYRRALRKLADAGEVVDMGRHWRYGRRMYALPEAAEKYRERVRQVFGRASGGAT